MEEADRVTSAESAARAELAILTQLGHYLYAFVELLEVQLQPGGSSRGNLIKVSSIHLAISLRESTYWSGDVAGSRLTLPLEPCAE